LQDNGELFPKDADGNFIFSDDEYIDTYKSMEKLADKGLAKAIGLSNFNSEQIQKILDNCSVKPAMLQVESHPWFNQNKLQEFCQSKGIPMTAYSPLGSPDRPWAVAGEPTLLADAEIKVIADKYSKNNAQVLIKFQLQKGRAVIPKSLMKSRLASNIDVFDFELTAEDMAKLDAFDKGKDGRLCHINW
jgi:diketogulonate reductase-like aldo/keto reductase